MGETTVEQILLAILSALDAQEALCQAQWEEPKRPHTPERWDVINLLPNLDDASLTALFHSIPKETVTSSDSDETREKSGHIEMTSGKGYEYRFFASLLMSYDRTFQSETLDVARRIPNEKFGERAPICRKTAHAAPVTGDAETIAKRVISRLSETETEEAAWVLGGSFEAEAYALFRKIPKQRCEHKEHTSFQKGELTVFGDDGLEYRFVAQSSSDCGGSEWYDEETLWLICNAVGLSKCIYSHAEYSR